MQKTPNTGYNSEPNLTKWKKNDFSSYWQIRWLALETSAAYIIRRVQLQTLLIIFANKHQAQYQFI